MPHPLTYSEEKLHRILSSTATIAMVGASAKPYRPSHGVMVDLQSRGFRVIPVNPSIAGQDLLGERVYASLRDIPEPVDMVDVFRVSEAAPQVVADAIAIRAKTVWMQLGVRHDQAAAAAEGAGLDVVMDRCVKIELARLGIAHH